MKIIIVVGRIIFGFPLLMFGFNHFMYAKPMSGLIPSYFPFPLVWVYLTGIGLIAAAVSLFLNKQVKLSMYLLAAMFLVFVITIHLPSMPDQSAMIALLKDLMLAGACLFIAEKN